MITDNSFSIVLFVSAVFMFFNGWWQTKNSTKYKDSYKLLSKSKRAGRSQEHWSFSMIFAGKLYSKYSIILVAFGVLGIFLNFSAFLGFVFSITIILILVFIIAIKTENALIDKFGK